MKIRLMFEIILFSIVLNFSVFSQEANANNEFISLNQDSTIFTIVPEMPRFGKNKKALQKFIHRESHINTSKNKTPTTKDVFVQIIIEKDGSVNFDKILKGSDEDLNNEAKRIAETMPNWKIGRLSNGTPVRVCFIFPVWFK